MKRSFHIIHEMVRKEFFQLRHDPRMLVVSMVAPVLQVILLGYAATTDIKNSTMVVCDLDHTQESRELVHDFTNSGYFIARYNVESPSGVDQHIERAKANIGLVIPNGFGRNLLARKPAAVQVILDGADANTANVLLGYATQIVATRSAEVLASSSTLLRGMHVSNIVPEPRVWFNPDLKSANYMVPGVVALVLMIITMTLTSLGIVKEKEIGTLEQLMVTPIRPHELILGKLVPFILIGFVDMTIVLGLARFWFGVPMLGSVMLLFLLSALFILTTLGLGLFVSTIAKSQQQAMLIAQFFFFMPFMFFSGFIVPIANMPVWIQSISYLIPLRYFLEIVRGIFLKGTDMRQLWPQTLALAAFGVTILALSITRFRKTLE